MSSSKVCLVGVLSILFLFGLISCEKTPVDTAVHVTDVTMNQTSLELTEGEVATLTATVSPSNATNRVLLWVTGNAKVATVTDGIVKAVGVGTTVITAKSDDGGYTSTCTVTVTSKGAPITDLSLNKQSLVLAEGESEVLIATISPKDAVKSQLTWYSDNTPVAKVDNNGKVTALFNGTATIFVKAEGFDKTASCIVTVTKPAVKVTGVSLNKTSLTMFVGDEETLKPTVSPSNASNQSVYWSNSDPSVAEVSATGVVTAKSVGTTTITVTTEDGSKTASCNVTVQSNIIAVTSVTLNKTTLSLRVGESFKLNATVMPDNATDKTVSWSSLDPKVATVSNDGTVTALAAGGTVITAMAGGESATCAMVVSVPATGVSLDRTTLSMTEGDTQVLTATITPSNTTSKLVSWTSSNSSVASVDNNGKVTANSKGSVVITAKVLDGGFTATCTVTVSARTYPVTGVTLNTNELTLNEKESVQLTTTITPDNASNKKVSWVTGNSLVATVNNGLVKAVNVGTTVISVITDDGQFIAQCTVTVISSNVPVTEVKLNKSSLSMMMGDVFTLEATVTPEHATNTALIWASDNTGVATVSNGIVTAISAGTANIIVRTEDGGFTASCKVTVSDDITRFVSAQYLGGAITMINDLIQYGSILNFSVTNNSSQPIVVDYVQLIDGSTGSVGNKLTINTTINGGESQGWSITIGLAGIHSPTARFTYTYRGEQYTCEAKYVEWSIPNF